MLVSVGKLGNDIFDTFLSFTLVISTKFGTKQLIWNANINYRNKRSVVIQSGENLGTIKKFKKSSQELPSQFQRNLA